MLSVTSVYMQPIFLAACLRSWYSSHLRCLLFILLLAQKDLIRKHYLAWVLPVELFMCFLSSSSFIPWDLFYNPVKRNSDCSCYKGCQCDKFVSWFFSRTCLSAYWRH